MRISAEKYADPGLKGTTMTDPAQYSNWSYRCRYSGHDHAEAAMSMPVSTSPVMREREISSLMTRLENSLKELSNAISILHDRLLTVLPRDSREDTGVDTNQMTPPADEATCPLGNQLWQGIEEIHRMVCDIQNDTDHLAL